MQAIGDFLIIDGREQTDKHKADGEISFLSPRAQESSPLE